MRRLLPIVLFYALSGSLAGVIYVALNGMHSMAELLRGGIIGFAIGTSIVIFENWVVGRPPHRWFLALPFLVGLLVRSIVYAVIASICLGYVAYTASPDPAMAKAYLMSTNYLVDIIFSFCIAVVLNFVNAMRELLGGRKFANVLAGRYHRPRQENRIFLFIDMKNTTGLAERIGDLAFHGMLAEFCEDVGRAILRHGGEIDRFVGDQVVATWSVRPGSSRAAANCYRAIAEAKSILAARAKSYIAKYGAPADLRAGLHCGRVVAGELGVGRREIGFVGDAVNTAARIEQSCRAAGEDILASSELVALIPPPADLFSPLDLEPIPLRGKAAPMPITALRLKPALLAQP